MKPPFSLLLLRGDGSRVVRLTVPRPVVFASLGLLVLVAGIMACVSGRYLLLQSQASQLLALREVVGEQRAFIDAFQLKVAAIRDDIDSWKALHAKMQESIPGGGPDRAPSGMGGPREDEERIGAQSSSLDEELDLLTTAVKEEGPRLRELEQVMSRNARIMAALPLRWPVRGPVNSEFGTRSDPWDGAKEHHGGIDIGVPLGGPVKAPAAGTVAAAGARPDYGNCITLDHGNEVRSLYGHLSKILVKPGDHVEKGQVIGLAGSTGRSTGPHLHYEVHVKGRPVNPRSFLWEK